MKHTDFHTHTYLSDGVLGPAEHIRRMIVKGYDAIAITDHVDSATIDHVLKCLDLIRNDFEDEIIFLPGVEITHVPPSQVAFLASKAKKKNFLVVVHGETIVEPVAPGTNRAAVECPDVDILAHPGILTQEEVQFAKDNDIFLEITTRGGHALGNGRVAELALEWDAKMLVNSDAHTPSDFMSRKLAQRTAIGAGIPESMFGEIFGDNPEEIIKRIRK